MLRVVHLENRSRQPGSDATLAKRDCDSLAVNREVPDICSDLTLNMK